MADEVFRVIAAHRLEEKVICVESDTPSVMKKLWHILEERSGGKLLVIPCMCHVLNLMLKVRWRYWSKQWTYIPHCDCKPIITCNVCDRCNGNNINVSSLGPLHVYRTQQAFAMFLLSFFAGHC